MESNVQFLLKQVAELSNEERHLVLTKLTAKATEDDMDKDTPESISRRSKAAVSWLQCNYEEDKTSSVHKQDVYGHYIEDCEATGQLPLSGMHFGKIIKMVFPSIHNRRLGQRGQSRYCHFGLKRKEEDEKIPKDDVFHKYSTIQPAPPSVENSDVYHLSCQLVCEWASQLLDKPFSDIKSLSEYLISIGLSCGKTAAKFTLMSGSTSPPKLAVDKKTLSSRLVQRRLQHNELIRNHKEKIKEQLKLRREQRAALTQQWKSPVTSQHQMVLDHHTMSSSNPSSTSLPRPLSVQPYMCSSLSTPGQSLSSVDNPHSQKSIWCVTVSSEKTGLPSAKMPLQTTMSANANTTGHSPIKTKRCQSTSVVEKHLVPPYNLAAPLILQLPHSVSGNVEESEGVQCQSQTQVGMGDQMGSISVTEGTSRSPSISPVTAVATSSSAARNISRLLESPAPAFSEAMAAPQQNKRNGDSMSPRQESDIKKRCTTSIGVAKQCSLDVDTKRKEKEFTVVRPFSCPISFQRVKSGIKTTKPLKCLLKSKPGTSRMIDRKETSKQLDKEGNQESKTSENPTRPESYHLVQKPVVISRPENCASATPNLTLTSSNQEPAARSRYNILNSLLSSDCTILPNSAGSLFSTCNPNSKPTSPVYSLATVSHGIQVPYLRRISSSSHTNDSSGVRSAFVPVTSQKQLTNSTSSEESTHRNLALSDEGFDHLSPYKSMSQPSQPTSHAADSAKSAGSMTGSAEPKGKESSGLNTDWKAENFFSQHSSASSSSSSSSSSTLCQSGDSMLSVVDSAFATPTPTASVQAILPGIVGSQKTPPFSAASAPATLSKVSSSVAPVQVMSSAQSTSRGPEGISVLASSPNVAPRKSVKNRFTPIRPKLDGCFNISPQKLRPASTTSSPQKRDMRPVHTILQEHRVKTAKDLLANLAHSCQAELNLSASRKGSSAGVIVSIGPAKSETLPKAVTPLTAPLNSSASLSLPESGHVETPAVITSGALTTSTTIFHPQISPVVPLLPLQHNSQMILMPTPLNQPASRDQPILVQDTKGNQFSVEEQPSGTLLLHQDLQGLVQGSSLAQIKDQTTISSDLLSLNSLQAHVVGPDAQGQSYLLVPNSEPMTSVSSVLPQLRSKSCVPLAAMSPVKLGPTLRPTSLGLTSPASSSDLLAELSQLASKNDAAATKPQALIQHNSTVSAFHKCTSQVKDPQSGKADVTAKSKKPVEAHHQNTESIEAVDKTTKLASSAETINLEGGETDSNNCLNERDGSDSLNTTGMKEAPARQDNASALGGKFQVATKSFATKPMSCAMQSKNGIPTSKVGTDLDDHEGQVDKLADTIAQETNSPQQMIRKRKATAGENAEHEGKKRSASVIVPSKGENVENVEPQCMAMPSESLLKNVEGEANQTSGPVTPKSQPSIAHTKTVPALDTTTKQTDTETLLNMIGDTKSMTVKEVVSALNKLRERLKSDQGQDTSSTLSSEHTNSSQPSENAPAASKTRDRKGSTSSKRKPKTSRSTTPSPAPSQAHLSEIPVAAGSRHHHRPSRRNVSLNLESLEIDALLDLDPSLDSKLVEDIRDTEEINADRHQQTRARRTSVGTVAKTLRQSAMRRSLVDLPSAAAGSKVDQPPQTDSNTSSNEARQPCQSSLNHGSSKLLQLANSQYTVSATGKEKRPASVSVMVSVQDSGGGQPAVSSVDAGNTPRHIRGKAMERSVSCVQDILTRGVSCKRDDVTHHFSSVVGKISKSGYLKKHSLPLAHSKALTSSDENKRDQQMDGRQLKSPGKSNSGAQAPQTFHEKEDCLVSNNNDSDLPVDVIDFITESMPVGNLYQYSPFTQNPVAWLTDMASCTPCPESSEATSLGKSQHTVKKVPSQMRGKKPVISGDSEGSLSAEAVTAKQTCNQTVSDFEKDIVQEIDIFSAKVNLSSCSAGNSQDDGTFLSPTGPARTSRRPSMERSVSSDRNATRTPVEQTRPPSRLKMTRADTPMDRSCLTPSDLSTVIGKQPSAKRECYNARDHTTALMLQQPVGTTQRTATQIATDFSETCINSFVHQGSAELCRGDRALSETPVSDPGYSSVGQTPVSEVGCSSVSPSPIMMSGTGAGDFGHSEIGSASTFMPVKSDSELNRLNNNTSRGNNESDWELSKPLNYGLSVSSSPSKNVECRAPSDPGSLIIPTMQDEPSRQTAKGQDSRKEDISSLHSLNETMCALSDLEKIMSVRLQCIPTPPSSPTGSPQPRIELLNSPSPYSSPSNKRDESIPSITAPCFIPPLCPPNTTPSSSVTMAAISYRLNITTNNPAIMAHPDIANPGLMSRFSPSTHMSTRPSCSPHQHYPHPSPPFTPSSQRCPTPSSVPMVSPRSGTPCGDSNSVPNRFMPIQTSGILATSLTTTQTYIQPIKPVVTLASAASQKDFSSTFGPGLSGCLSTMPTSRFKSGSKSSSSSSDSTKSSQRHFLPFQASSSMQTKKNAPKTTHHTINNSKPKERPQSSASQKSSTACPSSVPEKIAQPALVLSLSGNIGSVSGQGMHAGWGRDQPVMHPIAGPNSSAQLPSLSHPIHSKKNLSQGIVSQDQGAALPSYREAMSQLTSVASSRVGSDSGAEKPLDSMATASLPSGEGDKNVSSVPQLHTVRGLLTLRRSVSPAHSSVPLLSSHTLAEGILSTGVSSTQNLALHELRRTPNSGSVRNVQGFGTQVLPPQHIDYNPQGLSLQQKPSGMLLGLTAQGTVQHPFIAGSEEDSLDPLTSRASPAFNSGLGLEPRGREVFSSSCVQTRQGPTMNMGQTRDDLEETLDVLKTLDSQYFLQDEDSNGGTSL